MKINWIQGTALIISGLYFGIMAFLFLKELIEKISNYFNNSRNGKVAMRDEGVKDENGFANRIRRGACKIKGYVVNAFRFVQKKAKVILEAIGIIPRSYSAVTYKKRKIE
jgi:hypothetical protein